MAASQQSLDMHISARKQEPIYGLFKENPQGMSDDHPQLNQ